MKWLISSFLVLLAITIPICNTKKITAQPPAPTDLGIFTTPRLLSVVKTGTGTGTVTGTGVNCGTNCFQNYENGTNAILTASPDSGSLFTGWSGGGCTGAGSCTVTMSSAQTVTAIFTLGNTPNKFASTTGTGAPNLCTNSSSPCSLTRALATLSCGDTLQVGDGEYTGSPAMLVSSATTPAITCPQASQAVTVQAQTDGGVLFTGPNTAANEAVTITGATYWNFTGFNARRGFDVLSINNSHHVNLRRIVAWDAPNVNINSHVILVNGGDNILLEDIGVFGLATETILDWSAPSSNTWRRVWSRTEGWTGAAGGPSVAAQYNYTGEDWPTPTRFENVIMTAQATPRAGTIDYVINTARHNASTTMSILGNIFYLPSGATTNFNFIARDGSSPVSCKGYTIQDTVISTNGNNHAPISNPGSLQGCDTIPDNRSGVINYIRVNSVRGTTSSSYGAAATLTNVTESTTLAGTGFDYVGTGNTARLCFQYVDGVYTSTKLWPWPMDDRIKAAIASNSGSASLAGSAGAGYAAGTVTSEIVSIFGAIPSQCIN